jgi:hypothetical protein
MEPKPGISEEIKNFVSKQIHSIEELETLFLLADAPENLWTTSHVSQKLDCDERTAAALLEELKNRGFLISKKMPGLVYQFAPESKETKELIQALVAVYKERRIQVLQLVVGKSEDRLRAFSDAFKMRRKDDS